MWRSCTLTDKETPVRIPELIQGRLAGWLEAASLRTCTFAHGGR